jgi:hypothetical protein
LDVLRTATDVADAAIQRPGTVWEPLPPIPNAITDAVSRVDQLLAGLAPASLRTAAADLGLDRATARVGTLHTIAEQDRRLPIDGTAGPLARDDREDSVLTALSGQPSETWDATQLAALRTALRLHLARIGDVFMCASEWQPPRLAWQQHTGAGWSATRTVPGAPHPLEGHLTPTRHHRDHDTHQPLFVDSAVPHYLGYEWSVGWRDNSNRLLRYGTGHQPTAAAARFSVEVVIAALAAEPHTLRAQSTGQLLVPRSAGTRSLDALVIDLAEILLATMNQHRHERDHAEPTTWAMAPHRTSDTDLGSVVAVLFDHLGLPYPERDDPACGALPGAAEFDTFLATQAVALTPWARYYLIGMGRAGDGQRPLSERHAAGLSAILEQAGSATDRVRLELPQANGLPLGLLRDIDRLEGIFTP